MANKIKFKRGLKVNLPTLEVGEPAFTTDEKKLYVGTVEGNTEIGGDLSEIETTLKTFSVEEGETVNSGLNFTQEFLETATIYYGEEGDEQIKVVENGVGVNGWEYNHYEDDNAFVIYSDDYGDDMLWFFYEDNEGYEANKGDIKDNAWYGFTAIVSFEIYSTESKDKDYIFYKKSETYNKKQTEELVTVEKQERETEDEVIFNNLQAISSAIYSFHQEFDLPIILGTIKEPKENSILGKYTNSYLIIPEKVVNGDYVEYHFDTSKWPFNKMVEVYEGGDVFIKIPKMYIKLEKDGDIIKNRYISDTKIDGTWISSPIFYDYNEGVELDYVLVGKYNGFVSGNNLFSQSGKEPMVSTSITNFRTYARNRGSGYQLFDMHIKFILETLYLIVFGNTHPDTYFPQGTWINGKQNTGVLDGMEHHTGYYKGLDNYLMKFMGIENYFSNIYTWVDGVKTYQGNVYVCDNATNYNSDNNRTNYNNIGEVASDGYISELGTSQGLFSIPKATDGNNGEDYYQNYCFSSKTGTTHYTLYFGRDWNSNVYDGLFSWNGFNFFTFTNLDVGSRLVKKPL